MFFPLDSQLATLNQTDILLLGLKLRFTYLKNSGSSLASGPKQGSDGGRGDGHRTCCMQPSGHPETPEGAPSTRMQTHLTLAQNSHKALPPHGYSAPQPPGLSEETEAGLDYQKQDRRHEGHGGTTNNDNGKVDSTISLVPDCPAILCSPPQT